MVRHAWRGKTARNREEGREWIDSWIAGFSSRLHYMRMYVTVLVVEMPINHPSSECGRNLFSG